jgi:hypothetical protein
LKNAAGSAPEDPNGNFRRHGSTITGTILVPEKHEGNFIFKCISRCTWSEIIVYHFATRNMLCIYKRKTAKKNKYE